MQQDHTELIRGANQSIHHVSDVIYLKATIAMSPTQDPSWEECALLTAVAID